MNLISASKFVIKTQLQQNKRNQQSIDKEQQLHVDYKEKIKNVKITFTNKLEELQKHNDEVVVSLLQEKSKIQNELMQANQREQKRMKEIADAKRREEELQLSLSTKQRETDSLKRQVLETAHYCKQQINKVCTGMVVK